MKKKSLGVLHIIKPMEDSNIKPLEIEKKSFRTTFLISFSLSKDSNV